LEKTIKNVPNEEEKEPKTHDKLISKDQTVMFSIYNEEIVKKDSLDNFLYKVLPATSTRYTMHHANEVKIVIEVKKEEIIFEEKESYLVIVNDITDLISAEQLRAQNKSKDLILATTSHELKTPLNSINGMHLLLEDHVD
jgi:signal transduction histidine kinase